MNNNFKIIFKKFLKEIKQTAVVVFVFVAVCFILPTNGAEAALKNIK